MGKHNTNNIQALLMFCRRFDGKDKAHCLEYKDRLRVVLSFNRQSVAAIFQRDPKPTAAQNFTAVAALESARTKTSSSSCSSPRRVLPTTWQKRTWARPGRMGSVTDKQHGMPWKRSRTATRRRLGGRTTKSCTVLK